ncbi:Putative protein of unknown function [Podospora comata]|uniref:Protein kinase domain-containing protein n=1 Tax=Podospora comata TaxID=48703 RepID=A0ABY6SDX0_PODCO|nr:Putative protein of unknown function [Podospora comata]
MRIWLHNRYSTHGTAVGYNGQNEKEIRLNEMWILAFDPGAESSFRLITVASGGLAIRIEFSNHQGKEAHPAVTEPPSEAQTTSERLIYFKERKIGSGIFGRVFRLIRARDGQYCAGKVFTPPPTSKKRRRGETDPV